MKPLPLFGTGIRAISDLVTRQRRVNTYFHIREDQDRAPIIMCGTPGATQWITLPESPVWGLHTVRDTLYVVAGIGLYSVTAAGIYTRLGDISTVKRKVSMSDNSFELLVVDGVSGYICTLATGAVTAISDPDFPYGTVSVDFINSRFIAQVPGTREFRLGATLDGGTWSPMIFGTKENASDLLSAVTVLNGVVILHGSASMEFWQDIGTSPNPLQRITGTTQPWGLAAVNSRAMVGNTVVFLGVSQSSAVQVIKLSGYTATPISTDDIDHIVSSFSVVSDAVALTYAVNGHVMYQLTFPTEDRSLLYDNTTGIWSEVQTGVSNLARHFAELGVSFNKKNYVSDESSGKLYLVDQTAYTDDGAPARRLVYTRHIRSSGNPMFLSEVLLDFETGVGLVSGQGSDPVVMVRVSRDGGHTFGNERRMSLGKLGEVTKRVILRRLGSAMDFVLEISVTDPVKFVLSSGSARIEATDD